MIDKDCAAVRKGKEQYGGCIVLQHVVQPFIDYHVHALGEFFERQETIIYSRLARQKGVKAMEESIRDAVERISPCVVFVFMFADNYQLTPEFLDSLRGRAKVVFWLFDEEVYLHAHSKYLVQCADAVVTTDPASGAQYRQWGVPAMTYFSSYPRDAYRPAKAERDIDVSFVGLIGKGRRREMLDYLRQHDIGVEVYGRDTENGYLSLEGMVDIFNRSRINLNFTGANVPPWVRKDDPLAGRVRQSKGRPIEVSLTRSFTLSETAPFLSHIFTPGVEIDTFDSPESLLSQVRRYLHDHRQREAMAEAAYRRAVREYGGDVYFPVTMQRLFDALELPPARSSFCRSTAFRRRHLRYLFGNLRKMLSYGWNADLPGELGYCLTWTARHLASIWPFNAK